MPSLPHPIQKLEEKLLQPDVRKSPTQMDKLLADDFFEFSSTGDHYTKQEIIDILPTLDESKYTLSNFKTIELSPNTVLATYKIESELIKSGEKKQSLRSSLWQNKDNKWKMTFHQGTPSP